MITRVTITGADNSISPLDLVRITRQFPFVEWGILVSKNSVGNYRFPSFGWINELINLKKLYELPLSLHLSGMYVRDMVDGKPTVINDLPKIWRAFDRVQINTHAQNHNTGELMMPILNCFPEKEFIFQFDNVNGQLLENAINSGVNCSALFDLSHGTGVLPEKWPKPLKGKCGYAGGLGPDNIQQQIHTIESIVGEKQVWIDMETKVRSENDSLFDLNKVVKCLEISKPYVTY